MHVAEETEGGASVQQEPYLSIVLASRNDEYVPGTQRRLRACIEGMLEQLERYGIPAELLLVDWNPPPDRPPLRQAIRWPDAGSHCHVRVVEVPAPIHRRYPLADRLPFLVHCARNTGIRRARGRFVLSTGTDVLFSDSLMEFLAARELDVDRLYRVERYDVDPRVLDAPSPAQRLDGCRSAVLQRHTQEHGGFHPDGIPRLHTNASGDFLLLASEWWRRLHGLPEEADYSSVHFDSVMCYRAVAAGAREIVLPDPMRVYHVDHQSVWRPRRGLIRRLGQRVARRLPIPEFIKSPLKLYSQGASRFAKQGIPVINEQEFYSLVTRIMSGSDPFTADESWGLGDEELEEFQLAPADVPA